MALERRTILDQIEIKRDGIVQVRLAKQIVDDDAVLRSEWHRFTLAPGADVESSLPVVNAHLESLNEAAVADEEWDRVRRVVEMEQTPDVVQAFVTKEASEMARQGAPQSAG